MASPNAMRVLDYMKEVYPAPVTKAQIAEALAVSLSTVIGSVNSLEKKGLASHTVETETVEVTEGKAPKSKNVMWHILTDAGLTFDPVEAERLKEEEKAQLKAAKKAEKDAAKASKSAE